VKVFAQNMSLLKEFDQKVIRWRSENNCIALRPSSIRSAGALLGMAFGKP
jgi:hypothetical protein